MLEDVRRLFEEIASTLALRYEASSIEGRLTFNLPAQPRLEQDVILGFDGGDELLLGIGKVLIWYFPAADADRVAQFREDVIGLLTGRYRIATWMFSAKLQRPNGRGWDTMSGSITARWLGFTPDYIINDPEAGSITSSSTPG